MSFFRNFPKTSYDYFNTGVNTRIIDLFRYVKPLNTLDDELTAYTFYKIEEGDRPDIVSQKVYGTPEYYWTFFIINDSLRTGLGEWPMSFNEFDKYMAEEYSGVTFTFRPQYNYTGDGLLHSIENSVAGKFQIGETVIGTLSGATGKIESKEPTMQQLSIVDVVGTFRSNEIIRGQTTLNSSTTYKVFDTQVAPHHYEDNLGRRVNNAIHIDGGLPPVQLNTVTNYEYEYNLNEQRSNIRIVSNDRIFEFADSYQELLNT
jgi:hypothetical protein